MNDDPGMKLNLEGGGEFEATRENTSLFTYLGHYACYDHVFVQMHEEDQVMVGTYIFNMHPAYPQVMAYMIENCYPMHLNLLQPAQCDEDAFNRMIRNDVENDLDNGLPGEWLDGNT